MKTAPLKIYLAGKIRKNCWRHKLVSKLREKSWDSSPVDCGGWLYTGPFFSACDHGCYHTPSGHGSINLNANLCDAINSSMTRADIHNQCLVAITRCDILLAYIDEHECYGTVAEIQIALCQGKRVVVAFSPEVANPLHNEFWFVTHLARTHYYITVDALPKLIDDLSREAF